MNDRTKDYVFISYSHQTNIDGLVQSFEDFGYNIVYDTSMQYGEEWDLKARRYIKNNKCKGVVLVVSSKALISKAILRELEYASSANKKLFCIMTDDLTLSELYNSIVNTLNEDQKYIMDNIMEFLSEEKIFVPIKSIDWQKIKETFATWDFYSEKNDAKNLNVGSYTSLIKGEKERLAKQQGGYYKFDMNAINQVLDSFDRTDLCVLDLGCSNGKLTISRFGTDTRIKKVIGIDYNDADISEAKEVSKQYGDRFSFHTIDLESSDVISQINKILNENKIKKVDIVFSALTIHHLKNAKILLLQLYDIFSEDGKIILRGSDDGGKLCYPENELL